MKISVLGAGTWGIALANQLAGSGHHVSVWSALPEEIEHLTTFRSHQIFPEIQLHESIVYLTDLQKACGHADIILLAVPSAFVRSTVQKAAPFLKNEQIVVIASKGIEEQSLSFLSDVVYDEIKNIVPSIHIAVISGPTHAEEVIRDLPTTIVAACSEIEIAERLQDVFMSTSMRVYTNFDIRGVELCGALKNVIALGAGISAGLGYGDNAKAALITRGLAEIKRLGIRMGCMEQTFDGLAGMGDLIVTATSEHSRNYKAGYYIGKGYTLEDAKNKVGMVVEGLFALSSAVKLSEKYQTEVPIIHAVHEIVHDHMTAKEAVQHLMMREKRSELPKSMLDLRFENAILRNGKGLGMKRVITYGTFDLLHYGHINLLKRAKALGDYLIVVLSTDEFNWREKQKKCYFTYEQRKALLEAIRYVDLVIPESSWEQKISDAHEYHIHTFVMGDDWKGKFDFLKDEGVEVVYLPRTPEISTTQIKSDLNGQAASAE